MTKKRKWFGLKDLFPYIKKYVPLIVVMCVLGVLSSIADSAYPLFNRYALNHYIGKKTLDTIGYFAFLYLLILVLQVIDNFVSSYICSKVELDIGRDLKNASFNHLQTLSFSYYNNNNVGYILARVMSDTDRIGTFMTWRVMDFVWNTSYIVAVFVVMLLINWKLALLLLILMPIASFLITFFQRRMIALNRQIREINSKITGNFNEGITGAKTIKTLVVEDRIARDF
jgi:ATP-binding cassette subfamily B protein